MSRRICAVLFLAILVMAASPAGFAQPLPAISGAVVSIAHGPVQGATVSLVHKALGRGAPVFSGPNGDYAFFDIPPRREPYYIEVYWGKKLLFRGMVNYTGGSVRFDIRLP